MVYDKKFLYKKKPESTLSDKGQLKKYGMSMIYEKKDVKEFIKDVKEIYTWYLSEKGFKKEIDKLAGDKLTK